MADSQHDDNGNDDDDDRDGDCGGGDENDDDDDADDNDNNKIIMMPANTMAILEGPREEEFSPVKNPVGNPKDSPDRYSLGMIAMCVGTRILISVKLVKPVVHPDRYKLNVSFGYATF